MAQARMVSYGVLPCFEAPAVFLFVIVIVIVIVIDWRERQNDYDYDYEKTPKNGTRFEMSYCPGGRSIRRPVRADSRAASNISVTVRLIAREERPEG